MTSGPMRCCQRPITIPGGWDAFRCACGVLWERVGDVWMQAVTTAKDVRVS